MTPHNEAARGDYAEAVLLAGDPLRTEWIAATFLDDARCVNRVRGALGFTGRWKGVPVSVQTTGIGGPSLAIYAHELIASYGARILLRVGSCGGLRQEVRIRETVISQAAGSDAAIGRQFTGPFEFAPSPDFGLLRRAADIAAARGIAHHVGPTISSDLFYHPLGYGRFTPLSARGAIAVDMETSTLYLLAAGTGARALSICTVVDNLVSSEEIAPSERQEVFRDTALLALDAVAAEFPA